MRFIWTLEKLIQEALKYKTRSEFQKKSKSAANAAFNMKVIDIVCSHMPKRVDMSGENHPRYRWTLKKIQDEAIKYKTRGEFQEKSDNAFQAAFKRGLLDQICGHMEESATKPWLDEELHRIALKHSSRSELIENNFDVYKSAWRRGSLDKICSHMKESQNTSNPERQLLNIIKTIFPKTKRIRDSKVMIKSKPHIHGFDIDIFVSELNLGIEFDGKYYHSFEGLKRARKHWPDEDIHNYHEIKDAWFASKGIKILHINEKDWKNDSKKSIDKCLEFLGILKCA